MATSLPPGTEREQRKKWADALIQSAAVAANAEE
jgi:hypothetical protein